MTPTCDPTQDDLEIAAPREPDFSPMAVASVSVLAVVAVAMLVAGMLA